jgi:hypothetical protein
LQKIFVDSANIKITKTNKKTNKQKTKTVSIEEGQTTQKGQKDK